MLKTTTAERLKWLREEVAKIDRKELGDLAQLTKGHVWLIENGRRKDIGSSTANKLAAALGCSVEWLTAGEGTPPVESEVLDALDCARDRLKSAHKPTGT